MSCSHVSGCELFVQFALNPALELWKQRYCYGEWRNCARYNMSRAGYLVPMTLLPNGRRIDVMRSDEELGATALFNSIVKRRARMVQSLIRVGVNVNASNIEGTTALMSAIEADSPEIVRLLLENGADPTISNMHGKNALQMLVKSPNPEIRRLAGRYAASARARRTREAAAVG